jgi:hypothetical protein
MWLIGMKQIGRAAGKLLLEKTLEPSICFGHLSNPSQTAAIALPIRSRASATTSSWQSGRDRNCNQASVSANSMLLR